MEVQCDDPVLEQLGGVSEKILDIFKEEFEPSAMINYKGTIERKAELIICTKEKQSKWVWEAKIGAVFAILDKDGDDKITAKDFEELTRILGSTDEFKHIPLRFLDEKVKEVALKGEVVQSDPRLISKGSCRLC